MKLPILSTVTESLNQAIGLDLGSGMTRVWTPREGVVLEEPSCLAVDQKTGKVVAVGREAHAMAGRLAGVVQLYYPFQKGRLYDEETGRAMLRVFLQKVLKNRSFVRPIMMASIPAAATQAERTELVELLAGLGGSEVYTIAQPLAAAIGAGVPIADASGSFMLHMGSGVVEAAVISLASLVRWQSTTKAGLYADDQIRRYLRDKTELVISAEAAERLKQSVGTANPQLHKQMLVTGQDLVQASPKELQVSSELLQPVITKLLEEYEKLLKNLFTQMPPELTADVIDKGMLLSGGWGQLAGLETRLVNTLGIPVSVVDDPERVVIKGIGTALDHLDLFRQSLVYQV